MKELIEEAAKLFSKKEWHYESGTTISDFIAGAEWADPCGFKRWCDKHEKDLLFENMDKILPAFTTEQLYKLFDDERNKK